LNTAPDTAAISRDPIRQESVGWNNRRLFSLLWPLIVEQLLIVTMGLADTVMVSSVGEFAVSGVSLVDTIIFLFITAFNALATGGSVVASQYIGRGDGKNARCSGRQLVYVSVAISLIFMVFTLALRFPILRIIYGNIAEDVMHSAQIYFFITALSFPFLALYTVAAALFRSMGNSSIPMIIALLVNILNIGGNAVFIYGMGLGAGGAALATLIGRAAAALILFVLLLRNETDPINLKGIAKIRIEPVMIKRILNIGVPSGLENSMFQFGKILIARIFTAFGTAAIAANAIANVINSMGFMLGNAFGTGLLTIVGQCVGAGDYQGAKKYTKRILAATYLVYLIVNINVFFFRNQLMGFFSLSGEARKMAVDFLLVHCVSSTLFWGLSFVLPNALKAAGDARYVMIVAACTMWIVRVSAAFFMAFTLGMGPIAVFISMGMDFVFRGIFFSIRWIRGSWMEKRVI